LDRGLLVLFHHLDLDIAASDGTLEIGSQNDSRLAMVRVYNVPEVESQELVSNGDCNSYRKLDRQRLFRAVKKRALVLCPD